MDTPTNELTKGAERATAEVEAKLIQTWQRILGLPKVTRDDNFFELGGDSIKAMQFTAELAKQFGRDLPLPNLLTASLGDIAFQLVHHRARRSWFRALWPRR